MQDLKKRYEAGEVKQYNIFQAYIEDGGRVSLTTDGWSGNNKLDYSAVTGHIITKDGRHISVTLDIIELSDAVHDGAYLAKKLLEVIDRFRITASIISIIRDNASPNDIMLSEFEAAVADNYDLMDDDEKAQYFLRFTRVEGDVRYCAHIYNIAVQAALKAVKAEAASSRQHYSNVAGQATAPPPEERSAFFMLRCLALIFKQRKLPRQELKAMYIAFGIKFYELVNDMPVRWNSTKYILDAALHMEQPIRTVLQQQRWDPSIREHLTLADDDWDMLKELSVFFNLFARPTVQSQAEQYPTLYNAIPNYLHLIRQLSLWTFDDTKPFLRIAADAAHNVLSRYFKKSMATRHSFVAIICDLRYKLKLLSFVFESDGGTNAAQYKKGKAHFENIYSRYKQRAIAKKERVRIREENAAIAILEDEDNDAWRNDLIYGYAAYITAQQDAEPYFAIPLNTELERWFREPPLLTTAIHIAMAQYMASREYEFPIICQMARDFLAIPATSAPSERVFSLAGNLITKKRTNISSDNVRYVLCLRSWGFLVDDDDEVPVDFDADGEYIRPLRPAQARI